MRFFLSLLLVFGFLTGQSQDRPVRFVIGSFVVDGANHDLVRRLRSELENQLFDVVDQCMEQMEFIPDAQSDAIEYLDIMSTRHKRDYAIDSDNIPIPKQGNYILLVRFEPDNNGTYLQIGVFARDGNTLTYAGNGVAESDLAINKFYISADRKDFIKKAIQDAFSPQRLENWIREKLGNKVDLEDCLDTQVSSDPERMKVPSPNPIASGGLSCGININILDCYVEGDKLRIIYQYSCIEEETAYFCIGDTYCLDNNWTRYKNPLFSIQEKSSRTGITHKFLANNPEEGIIEFSGVNKEIETILELKICVNLYPFEWQRKLRALDQYIAVYNIPVRK